MFDPVGLFSLALLALPGDPVAQDTYLKAWNSETLDSFGGAVAADGDTIVVGAPIERSSTTGINGPHDNAAVASGAAYVFVRSGTTWAYETFLKASNTEAADRFGGAVAVSGDTIVIGATQEDSAATGIDGDQSDNSASNAGAVYVFVRAGSTWVQQAYVKASNTDASDLFGEAVAIDGDRMVVAASNHPIFGVGAVYVFERTGTQWAETAFIQPSILGAFDFGCSVGIHGDTIVVGARTESSQATGVNGDATDSSKPSAGAAYVFARAGTNWTQQAYLKASNTDSRDHFGQFVAIHGDTVAVSAVDEDSLATGVGADQGNASDTTDAGAVYIFARQGTSWSQQAYIKASNSGPKDDFGHSVALFGDRLIVGAPDEDSSATGINGDDLDDTALGSGAGYLFERVAGQWSQTAYVKASNSEAGDSFGGAVTVAENAFVVGAMDEDSHANLVNGNPADNAAPSAGSGYVYGIGPPPLVYCTPKVSSAGCLAAIATSNNCAPPISGAGGYFITATGAQELKNGILFGGNANSAAIPFNGGTLCVQPPLRRGPVMNSSGGSPTGCSGAYSTLVNDGNVIPTGLDAGAGNTAWYQYWYRDPANGAGALGSALSNAVQLEFL